MKFSHPENLLWLLALLPLLGLFIYAYRARKVALERLGDKWLMMGLTDSVSRVKQVWKIVLLLWAAVFLLFGFAGPQVGERLKEVKRKGIDIVVALDVSNSMRAEDVRPSRLEKAKYEISGFVDKLGGDRVGLVVFAGQAFLQCPLTLDKSTLKLFLDVTSPDAVETQGTNIAEAIDEAIKAFRGIEKAAGAEDRSSVRNKVLIIVSDGEDHEAGIDAALRRASEEKIRIFTVGVGGSQPVPIPVVTGEGGEKDFKRGRDGGVVTTAFTEAALRQVAEKSGGTFYRIDPQGSTLERIYVELDKLQKQEFASKEFLDYDDKFQFFIGAGILLLVMESLIGDRKNKIKPV
ncbi:MAG: VWA domain-containing protein [Rhizobacter sp.]|nr:VWA domain-containing protein [Chlorobiales bacterium]